MSLPIVHTLSLVFVALLLGPSLGHLFELPNKVGLSRQDYLTVQQIYRGWALFGFVVGAALFCTLGLTVQLWSRSRPARSALTAFLCLVGTQVIFWTWTYPANVATDNWTILPDGWTNLRAQWEYSHAAGAGLNFAAFLALIQAWPGRGKPEQQRSIGSSTEAK